MSDPIHHDEEKENIRRIINNNSYYSNCGRVFKNVWTLPGATCLSV